MVEPTRFPAECGHVFCRSCMSMIINKSNEGNLNLRCPYCRRPSNLKGGEPYFIEVDAEYQARLKKAFPEEFRDSQLALEMNPTDESKM